jgi:hypothetical protein
MHIKVWFKINNLSKLFVLFIFLGGIDLFSAIDFFYISEK